MNIGIIGTRGIPNNYGGFEQFAEFLSVALVKLGHSVTVYNSHNHIFRESTYQGVNIVHCYDPEYFMGTAGQFIFDFNCILDSRKRRFDIILQLGYTSSSIWSFLFPKNSLLITNMDGLEWKRTKYSAPVKKFLRFAESLAARNSDFLVADSPAIKKYLNHKYRIESTYIPYGANIFSNPDESRLEHYKLGKFGYDLLIARMEPENNIEIILDGVSQSHGKRPCIVIGSTNNSFGKYLLEKYKNYSKIRFLGSVYDTADLNNLRYFSNIYFHGHSVGGTNPSLLEAMAANTLILAHKNEFNKAVLEDNAYYFENPNEVQDYVVSLVKDDKETGKIQNNLSRIEKFYNWEKIVCEYEGLFIKSINST
ncbi:MAG TPA: DUF1972 domain-containing protein [Oligoflexia bacterium]|nr:DUF1972 domain-containing protein [Oligoflexia bacterium]HMP49309.1 DUF1972 domain-containing protein [Oligoflexia bacterium]